MKTLTEMQTTEVKVKCPYCGEIEEGFFGDPRGEEFECEKCGERYKIHSDADIEFYFY